MRTLCCLTLFVLSIAAATPAQAERLRIATWNIANLHFEVGVPLRDGAMAREQSDYELLNGFRAQLDADIVAFQEVNGPQAAHMVFPASEYDVFVSGRFDDDIATGRETDHIYTGFAVRKGTIVVERNPDLTALSVEHVVEGEEPRPTRRGVDITVTSGDLRIRLLSVHLKSGCSSGSLESAANAHCVTLAKQVPILEEWIDARAGEDIPFMVLGDFNRRIDVHGQDDHLWGPIDDGEPGGLNLWRLPFGEESRCWEGTSHHHAQPIDFLVFDNRAWQLVDRQSFRQINYGPEHEDLGQRLSDHCPLSVDLVED